MHKCTIIKLLNGLNGEDVIDKKSFLIAISVCAIAGALMSYFSNINIVYTFLICIVAMLINGALATFEDNLPGGFNNPDGKNSKPQSKLHIFMRVIIWFTFTGIVLGFIFLWLNK